MLSYSTLFFLICLCFSSVLCLLLPSDLPTSCNGSPNSLPVVSAGGAQLINTVANGTLSKVLPSGANTPLYILHVYGDSYSQGYAYGQLLSSEIQQMLPLAYNYFSTKYHIPASLVNELLDGTRNTTKAFTPQWHFDLMQGISDGTGGAVAFLDIWRVAMIPELIKASCSIIGAWGPATQDGGLLQLRALDWGIDGPFQQFALLATFHPDDSYTYSSMGWVGMYGTITGWSSTNVALSEKVWDAYKKIDNIYGYPWTFMLQDILRYDIDVDEALARIAQASRTCAIWLGVGQGARPNPLNPKATLPANFKLVASSWEEMHFFNPENFPVYPPKHDYYPSLLFVNKHVQPSGELCMNDLIQWGYGNLTATDFYTIITALEETGDMHIAVFDFDAKQLYVANAAPLPNNSPAYNNGFVQFSAVNLWTQPHPTNKNFVSKTPGIATK